MINFIRTSKKGYIAGLFLTAIAGISAGCAARAETSKSTPPPPKKEVSAAAPTPDDVRALRDPYSEMPTDGDMEYSTPAPGKSTTNLTKTVSGKIKIGMTLAEVEEIMNEKGMLVSTMEVNGRKTQIYKWSNDNFSSYIDVTVENGKIVGKTEKGLK